MVSAPSLYTWYKSELRSKSNEELEEIIREYESVKGFKKVIRIINIFETSSGRYYAAKDVLRDR